jgi:ABC-type multidrug transport system permease subunit
MGATRTDQIVQKRILLDGIASLLIGAIVLAFCIIFSALVIYPNYYYFLPPPIVIIIFSAFLLLGIGLIVAGVIGLVCRKAKPEISKKLFFIKVV